MHEKRPLVNHAAIDPTIFRDIENVIVDLCDSHSSSFERHIQKLARYLHTPGLEPITIGLTEGVEIDTWIAEGRSAGGQMVGTGRLRWPSERREELGIVLALIDKFSQDANSALHFCKYFCYVDNNYTNNLQNLTKTILVPFARDYIEYVKSTTGTPEVAALPQRTSDTARKIFVVHGHDEGSREAVARFLEGLAFEVIILHEQASEGRTIIEKVEAHSDVGFAVILLTPDDQGCKVGGELQFRARQNVIVELGYFIGRLGRSRVCALKRGELEIPSDFEGVIYVPFDSFGGWKNAIAKELSAAGFAIDWNKVMQR